jgi:hypothetical protein
MGPESSLPCSKEPATGPYPEPDEILLDLHPISLRFTLILSCRVRLGLPSGLFHSDFSTQILHGLIFLLCVLDLSHPF